MLARQFKITNPVREDIVATSRVQPLARSLLATGIIVAGVAFSMPDALAQGAFPAPLPGQAPAAASPFPPASGSSSPFPPVNNAPPLTSPSSLSNDAAFSRGAAPIGGMAQPRAPGPGGAPADGQKCQTEFVALRQDAEKKAAVISNLSKRKGTAADACKAIGSFSQAEARMIKYVETNASRCGIPEQISTQMKKSHVSTEQMQGKVCAAATQQQQAPAGPSLSEALGGASLPEAKTNTRSGGSTFDTLNGNVLTR